MHSRIVPLVEFARNLKVHLDAILSLCCWPLGMSLLEVINNKIKVIKPTAYGHRDDE